MSDEISLTSLIVSKGDKLTPKLWARMLRWVERNMAIRGDVLSVQTASGRIIRGRGTGGASDVSHPWQMTLSGPDQNGNYAVTFLRGLVNGVEPTIDGTPIGQADQNGNYPALTVTPANFGPDRLARIYVQCFLDKTYVVLSAKMIALATTPTALPWTRFKLIGFLVTDSAGSVTVQQMAFFNLSMAVPAKETNGLAGTWWGAGG